MIRAKEYGGPRGKIPTGEERNIVGSKGFNELSKTGEIRDYADIFFFHRVCNKWTEGIAKLESAEAVPTSGSFFYAENPQQTE